MRSKRVLRTIAAVAALAVPGAVNATEGEVVGGLQAKPAWRVEAAGSYVATSDFGGWGVGLRGGWAPIPIFQFGLAFDTARLHAEGTHYQQSGTTTIGGPYSQTFQSTLVAAFARLQLPFRYATPYAEVTGGAVLVNKGEQHSTACYYQSGPGGGLSAGVDVHPVPSVAIGLRGGVRHAGWNELCTAQGGVWGFRDDMMKVASLTASYRW
jgi:hypothetical protein